MAKKTSVMALLLGGLLFVASEQGLDQCSQQAAGRCYDRYSEVLWDPQLRPNQEDKYDEDAYKQACRAITRKDPCHLKLSDCSAEVRSSLRHLEWGYEAIRDIVCNGTPLKGFAVASRCIDRIKLVACLDSNRPRYEAGQTRPPLVHPFCQEYEGAVKCYETCFKSSCQLPLEQANASFARAYDTLAVLRGCKISPLGPEDPNSAAVFLEPQNPLTVLMLVLLQRWTAR